MAGGGSTSTAQPTPMKTFIVDNFANDQTEMHTVLAQAGGLQVVGHSQHASEAVAAIARLKPDLVLLDIGLRRGHGYDVLKYTKRYAPAAIVIVFTHHDDAQHRQSCAARGADFFYSKSTDSDRVVAV